MSAWIETLRACANRGEPAVLVTVASVRGSTPREPGAKMVVTAAGLSGTIGGGHLELQATEISRALLASGQPGELHRFPLGASLGQCCGGLVNLLFEPVTDPRHWLDALEECALRGLDCVLVTAARGGEANAKLLVSASQVLGRLPDAAPEETAIGIARDLAATGAQTQLRALGPRGELFLFDPVRAPDFRITLFGAGHVGRALVRALEGLDCRVTWVDAREDQFPAAVPANARAVVTEDPLEEVDRSAPGCFFLVMTHSHALDETLAQRILERGGFAYFGLIGSQTKRRRFEKRLAALGVPASRLAAMTCPIGVAGIPGKQPAAIAIAVAAELLRVRGRGAAQATHRRDAPRALAADG